MHDLGPAPDGEPLRLIVRCRPTPTSDNGPRHPVVIGPDWSVALPHDIEAERVAGAFGGYNSCLVLVEEAIPAFRASLPLLLRRSRAELHRVKDRWRVGAELEVAGCCGGREYATAGQAARHLRTLGHLARQHRLPAWQFATVLHGAAKVWGPWEADPPRARDAESLVRDVGGLAELWKAGVHVDEIEGLAALAFGVSEALPVAYYLGLAYGTVDPEWLSGVVERRPDGDTAAWLAGLDTPQDTSTAAEWGAWLGYGLSRADVRIAVGAGIAASDVDAIVTATGWTTWTAAKNLVDWLEVGCRPSAEQFALLAQRRIDRSRPSRGAVDAACNEVTGLAAAAPADPEPDRTEIAILLQLLGSRPALVAAYRRGVRSLADLATTSIERSA